MIPRKEKSTYFLSPTYKTHSDTDHLFNLRFYQVFIHLNSSLYCKEKFIVFTVRLLLNWKKTRVGSRFNPVHPSLIFHCLKSNYINLKVCSSQQICYLRSYLLHYQLYKSDLTTFPVRSRNLYFQKQEKFETL